MKLLWCCFSVGLLLLALGWYGQAEYSPLRAAEIAYRAEDFARAAMLYGEAAPVSADPGHAVFNRAASLYELHQYTSAAEDFGAVQSPPETSRTPRAAFNAGNCLLRQACGLPLQHCRPQLESAIGEYAKAVEAEEVSLKTAARFNQELARKLLAQVPPADGDSLASDPQKENPDGGAPAELAMGDPAQDPAHAPEKSGQPGTPREGEPGRGTSQSGEEEQAEPAAKGDNEGSGSPQDPNGKSAAQPGDPGSESSPGQRTASPQKQPSTRSAATSPPNKEGKKEPTPPEPEQQCPT